MKHHRRSLGRRLVDRVLYGNHRLPQDHEPISAKRRSGIRANFAEGAWAQVFIILTGGKFLTDLVYHLGGSAWHLGLVNAIPFLLSPAQLLAAYVVQMVGSRKRVMIPAALLCREVWWFVPLLIALPIAAPYNLYLFIAVFAISKLAEAVLGHAWTSWTGDLIPQRIRGRVIASRNALLLAITAASDFALSELRETLGTDRRELYLCICFGVAAVAGLRTVFLLKRQWEPPLHRQPLPKLKELFHSALASKGLRHFYGAIAVWNVSIGVAVAYWSAHMIQNLQLPFTTITVYTLTITVGSFLMAFFVWGRVIDRAGAVPVLVACGFVIALTCYLWFWLTPENLLMLWVDGVLSGIAWSGFNAAIFSLPLQLAPQKNRAYFLGMQSSVAGLMLGLGSLLGGAITEGFRSFSYTIGGMTYTNFHIVFFLSGTGRLFSVLLLRKIPDVRSRGVAIMLQSVGDGVNRALAGTRDFIPMIFAPRRRRHQSKARRSSASDTSVERQK